MSDNMRKAIPWWRKECPWCSAERERKRRERMLERMHRLVGDPREVVSKRKGKR